MVTWRDDGKKERKRNRDEAVDESQSWTMEMNSTTASIVPGYYNASSSIGSASPVECNREIDTYGFSDFILYGVLINLIGLFGILGNTISMIILSRPQMKSSINYLLIGLARCDTVLIIVAVSLSRSSYISIFILYIYPFPLPPLSPNCPFLLFRRLLTLPFSPSRALRSSFSSACLLVCYFDRILALFRFCNWK